jgi:hypothetical protein
MHGPLNVSFEQCLLCEVKKRESSQCVRDWIFLHLQVDCSTTLLQYTGRTFKVLSNIQVTLLLSQFTALTALFWGIIAAIRNKFVLVQFPQWTLQKQDVMTQSNSNGSRHGPATAHKYVWVNEGMRTDYQIITHLFTCLPSNLLFLSMPSPPTTRSLSFCVLGLWLMNDSNLMQQMYLIDVSQLDIFRVFAPIMRSTRPKLAAYGVPLSR